MGRPRHSSIPQWHYDMLHDQQRNEAYETAIARAVATKRLGSQGPVHVLDMGTGTGLLSMFAARQGVPGKLSALCY